MSKEHTQNSRENKDNLARRIGSRFKELRKAMGLSLKQLAEETKLSAPLFSRIENGLVMPSIPTLQEIANTLKVDIGYFFKGEEDKDFVISRQGSRKISYDKRGPKRKVTYGLELLAEGMDNPFMEPCIVSLLARKDDEVYITVHDGQEFLYVLEGSLGLTLGEKKFTLNKGDAAYFNGHIEHKGISLTKKPAKTLNVHLIPGRRVGTFERRKPKS